MGPTPSPTRPRVVVAGLGPGADDQVPQATLDALAGAGRVLFRTRRHPSVPFAASAATRPVEFLDRLYEAAAVPEDVYGAIVEELVAAAEDTALSGGFVAYAVPGSPVVAERSVVLLRADDRVTVEVVHAPSFLDLAWERLGVDPLDAGVRLVDGTAFAADAAGERGPLLVSHCHSREILSAVKLSVDEAAPAVLLHHLGLPDERVLEVPWSEIDRSLEPDHLTALWVPVLAAPIASEVVRLDELVRVLRARCPWDREQTHGSLARHLLEESYETLDAIEALDAAEPDPDEALVVHLEEELGDLLFQVLFHARLAAEEGRFTLADVARRTHDKLVARHPHVFGDAVAETPEDVAARWEVLKKAEKGRTSVTEGIPSALPALALAAKLQRKAESVGMAMASLGERLAELEALVASLAGAGAEAGAEAGAAGASGETLVASGERSDSVGRLLFAAADVARRLGVDPETALRARATWFRRQVEASE
ncbi:MAG TPA: MazG family protein [Acidimicrobiales bacterium]|nr:MazG family protein [Acidimicrobiales bacterium]